MKRAMNLQDECEYIWDNYNRFKDKDTVDATIGIACMQIINWMERKDEFNNVIYYGGVKDRKGIKLKGVLGEKGIKALKE